jgi:hypothetical protein
MKPARFFERIGFSTMMPALLLAFFLPVRPEATAESIQKHHRVAEMEDVLRQRAGDYLKARFPDQPFFVTVNVEPLRRPSLKAKDGEVESLPYFDGVSDEINDEWDDPALSLQQLQLRTVRILVEITLNDGISDTEAIEVKENIVKSLHLTPVRDEVKIETRKWSQSSNRSLLGFGAFGIAILFLLGLYLINRQATLRITRAISEGGKSAAGPAPVAQAPAPTFGGLESRESAEPGGIKQGVELNDPLRISEIVSKIVAQIEAKPGFPSLYAMTTLDEYGKRGAGKLGAILAELPVELRNKLFSLSTGVWWFEAMMKADRFDLSQLDLLQRLVREDQPLRPAALETMLIHVWRLDEKMPEFLRSLNRESGMAILSQLPRGKAIEAARRAFPGAWADLLDSAYRPRELSEKDCAEITRKTLQVLPLRDLKAFERHKLEFELREFLLGAGVDEEREIYLASRPDSAIHTLRPPFFKVLDASAEQLRDFVGRFTPEHWSLALFNLPADKRKAIRQYFSEKQDFMFIETLKRLDRQHDDLQVGRARERIALEFFLHCSEMDKVAKESEPAHEENRRDEKNKAA